MIIMMVKALRQANIAASGIVDEDEACGELLEYGKQCARELLRPRYATSRRRHHALETFQRRRYAKCDAGAARGKNLDVEVIGRCAVSKKAVFPHFRVLQPVHKPARMPKAPPPHISLSLERRYQLPRRHNDRLYSQHKSPKRGSEAFKRRFSSFQLLALTHSLMSTQGGQGGQRLREGCEASCD